MQKTAGEVRVSSYATFSCGILHTDEQLFDIRLELIYKKLCTDTGCSLEDLPNAMDDRDEWSGRVREICTHGTIDIYI